MNISIFNTYADYKNASVGTDSVVYIKENDQVIYGSSKKEQDAGGIFYGVCTTSENDYQKTVTLEGFKLKENAILSILFVSAFYGGETLNVNGLGAKNILYFGKPIARKVKNNTVLTMIYDGTSFNVVAIEQAAESEVVNAVDLGLPSGRLWADRNVGAESPEGYGLYFSWGNVDGHTAEEVENGDYEFSGEFDVGINQWTGGDYASTDGSKLSGNISAGKSYDAARANMGGSWRMPTKEAFQELYDNCTWEWTVRNGVRGYLVSGNNNSIFFPAAGYCDYGSVDNRGSDGYYLSSSFRSGRNAFILYFDSGNVSPQGNGDRYCGFPVRAVQ